MPDASETVSAHASFPPVIGEIYDWVESLLMAMIWVVVIFTFLFRTVSVEGESMVNTLKDHDALVVTRLLGAPRYGDIVAVAKLSAIDRPLIKRVIAVGGQTIDIHFETGDVLVDGAVLDEPYIAERILPDAYFDMKFPQKVPEGCVFVMGDNRNNSWDSRVSALGMVDQRHILGKVVLRYLPIESFGVPE